MAENSRKNEHFELGRIAMIAMTTNSSMRVNSCFFIFFSFFEVVCLVLRKNSDKFFICCNC